jgi:Domain of unknown function (DUF4342)
MTEDSGGYSSTEPQGSSSGQTGNTASQFAGRLKPTADDLMARGRDFYEKSSQQLKPTTDDLMARGRDLYEKGNQRRFILEHDNRVMINLPLTVAAIIGLVVAVVAPWAAVLGILAALFTRVQIRIEEEIR